MQTTQQVGNKTLKILILASDGVDLDAIVAIKRGLKSIGISSLIIGNKDGVIKSTQGTDVNLDGQFKDAASIEYTAIFIPGGSGIAYLCDEKNALSLICSAYKNGKLIATSQGGEKLVAKAAESAKLPNGTFIGEGVISQLENDRDFLKRFIAAVTQGQSYNRPDIELMSP